MKTKKARQGYKCYNCKCKIEKGEQYARKSVVIGKTTTWIHDDPVPDWAWETYRSTEPVCNNCANPE